MQCPLCGYMMSSFDATCPRCHGKGLGAAKAPPVPPQQPPSNWGPVPPTPNYQVPPAAIETEDSVGTLIGYGVISALIPCAGIIVCIVSFAKSRPIRGGACLAGSVIGMMLGLFILGSDSTPSRNYIPTSNSISPSSSVEIAALEADTLQAYNDELARQASPVRGTVVNLTHLSGNSYTGFVDLNNGTRLKMDVTYDGNKLMFLATPIR